MNDDTPSPEETELEHQRLIIHGLLQEVSAHISTFLGENRAYSDSIDRHADQVKKAMTLAGLREVERVLLAELEALQATNRRYREQLDEANRKVQKQQEELNKLQTDIGLDFLTKVPNRRALDLRLEEEFNRVKRYGANFSLLIIDVDRFKDVNDTYGHVAGDRVLRAVAQLLNDRKRSSDFLARYGGEEFAMVLPQTSLEHAKHLANEHRKRVRAATFRYNDAQIDISISIGVGELAIEEDKSVDAFFDRVDAALYQAKSLGRDRVEVARLRKVPPPRKRFDADDRPGE